MLIVGLCGDEGAGKNSVVEELLRAGWRRIGFYDTVKQEVAAAFRVEPALFEDSALATAPAWQLALANCLDLGFVTTVGRGLDPFKHRSPRWVLWQWAQYRLDQEEDYLVARATRRVLQLQREGVKGVVLPDVYRQNEARAVRDLGGVLVRIVRSDNPCAPAGVRGGAIDQVDHTIFNTGCLTCLWRELLDVLGEAGGLVDLD